MEHLVYNIFLLMCLLWKDFMKHILKFNEPLSVFVSANFTGNIWKSFWNRNTPCVQMQAKLQVSSEHTRCFISVAFSH